MTEDIKINVRGTLDAMMPDDTIRLDVAQVRGTTLRSTASALREIGKQFVVKKYDGHYQITRIQ